MARNGLRRGGWPLAAGLGLLAGPLIGPSAPAWAAVPGAPLAPAGDAAPAQQAGPSKTPLRPGRALPDSDRVATTRDAAAGTEPLHPDRPVRVRLEPGQQAFFRVAPEAGTAFAVLTRSLDGDTDTVLAVLGPDGQSVAEDDDGGEGLASRIEVAPEDGVALVRAGTVEDAGGSFELVLQRMAPPPPPDFPTSAEAAGHRAPLAAGEAVSLRLRRGQAAFFALPRNDDAALTAITFALSGNTDTELALLDAEGHVIAENDDDGQGAGSGLASRLEIAAASAGAAPRPAFLRVRLVDGSAASGECRVALLHPAH